LHADGVTGDAGRGTRGADEVALEYLVAADAGVLAGTAHEALGAGTGGYLAAAFPLDKDLVTARVREDAGSVRPGLPVVEIVAERAIDARLGHESLALVIERDRRHDAGADGPVRSELLYPAAERPTVVAGIGSRLGQVRRCGDEAGAASRNRDCGQESRLDGHRPTPQHHFTSSAPRSIASTVSSRTLAPFAMSVGDVNSFGEWLIPPALGTKIIPVGATRLMFCAS